ncbi:cyclin-dependent kinase inhibitor 1 [Rhinatrema bivittatum]|uniref:cyclin-dependent kinase inhibitor 1 n=1 Tax=Rhinatrema bivittatum TaxID=194408 RepID=UPI0011276CBE|nr:cyclin-dependent kinase inhibitor 1 [Rhinatrema bivittatum]
MGSSRNHVLHVSGKVCRSLFGAVDHEQLKHDCRELLRSCHEEAKRKWNFDFVSETPLEGAYKWERVVGRAGVPAARRSPLLRVPAPQPHPEESERANAPGSSVPAAVEQIYSSPLPEEPSRAASFQGASVLLARSPRRAKRKQTVITDFYHSKRRNIQRPPKGSP